MRHFGTSIDIASSPERIWAVMIDVERWHEWTASITSIDRLDSGALGVGSAVRIRQPGFPAARWQIVSFEPNHAFAWVSAAPGMSVTGTHEIEPAGEHSRVTLSVHFDGPFGGIIGRLMRRVNERFLGLEAAGLKRRCEALSARLHV